MVRHIRKRKCKHCKAFFDPDPRNVGRQYYCAQPPCRQASKAASQSRWLHKPHNRDYFHGPTHVERVRQWRQAHPGYGRRKTSQVHEALQEPLMLQALQPQQVEAGLVPQALQDSFFLQPAIVVGLIAHLTGLSFQDDIALTARRLQQLGRDILSSPPLATGGSPNAQTTALVPQAPHSAPAVQLGRSAPGP